MSNFQKSQQVLQKEDVRADVAKLGGPELAGPEDDEPSVYSADLRKKTRWSILWTVVRVASDRIFSFIVFVILARLLSPREVGIFALAVAFSEVGRVIAIGGMVQNIPRARKLTPGLADTVFWTNLTMSIVVAVVVLAAAPLIMDLIGQPDAAAPLQALGFVLPIAALGATHMSLRLREFGHKSLAIRSVLGGTLGGTAAIVAAFAGWGVWSLVLQRFITEAANTATAWLSYKWMPGRNFSKEELRKIWSFGFHITTTQIIGMLPRRAMDLVLGALISAAAVGLNRTAFRTAELVMQGTISPFTTVAIQTLSRLQGDPAEMAKAYRWMISRSAMLTLPAMFGFGVLAPDAVPAIYGHKWEQAGLLAQILSLLAVPYSLSNFASPLLMALGRGSALQKLYLGGLVATVLFAVASAPFGLVVVTIVTVARSYLTIPFQMWFLKRASGITPRDSLSAISKPLCAAVIMSAGVWALMEVIRPLFAARLVPVLICVAEGMVIYAAVLCAISPEARKLVQQQLKRMRTMRARA